MNILVNGKQVNLKLTKPRIFHSLVDVLVRDSKNRKKVGEAMRVLENGKLDINLVFPIVGRVKVGEFLTIEDQELFSHGLMNARDISMTVSDLGELVEIITWE
jgi:hypothetical protein